MGKKSKYAVGCLTVVAGIVCLVAMFYLYDQASEYFQSPAVKNCISVCEKDEDLRNPGKYTSVDPVLICKVQCKKTEGLCPAKESGPGPYAGCIACGKTAGRRCD